MKHLPKKPEVENSIPIAPGSLEDSLAAGVPSETELPAFTPADLPSDSHRDDLSQTEQLQKEPPQTADLKPQTEHMEVHHHPEVEKKGLKEYLLEGLMIFIAVTMGFVAESIREHIADGAKETEYMHSMIKDLQADTAELNSSKMEFNRTCLVTDTILTCLKADNPDPFVINRAISDHFWSYAEYSYNNRTVQQLKNSGNFRLIHNNLVSGGILKYDNLQTAIMLTQYTDLKNTMYSYKDAEARVVYYKELKQSKGMSRVLKNFSQADFTNDNKQPFLTKDKELLNFYYNRLFIHEALNRTFLLNIQLTKDEATKLISTIKKEYHLEDE